MSLPTFSPRGAQAVQYGSWPCAEGTCSQHWTFADPCDVRVFAFTERAFAHTLVIKHDIANFIYRTKYVCVREYLDPFESPESLGKQFRHICIHMHIYIYIYINENI